LDLPNNNGTGKADTGSSIALGILYLGKRFFRSLGFGKLEI
jgi:hypothetical protein